MQIRLEVSLSVHYHSWHSLRKVRSLNVTSSESACSVPRSQKVITGLTLSLCSPVYFCKGHFQFVLPYVSKSNNTASNPNYVPTFGSSHAYYMPPSHSSNLIALTSGDAYKSWNSLLCDILLYFYLVPRAFLISMPMWDISKRQSGTTNTQNTK